MMTDLEREVLEFVNGTLLQGREPVNVTDRLFEDGHLDSVRVLELIRFLEERIGRRVPDRMIRLATFRSVRAIAQAFDDAPLTEGGSPPRYRYHTDPSRFASPTPLLRQRGELTSPTSGIARLSGTAAHLFDWFDATFAGFGHALGAEEAEVPPRIPLTTLERAGYLDAFPHQLVMVPDDATAAFAPAACYHCYPAHADMALDRPRVLGVVGRCRRAETEPRELEREVEFTMREVVAIGPAEHVERVHHRMLRRVDQFVTALSLDGAIEPATDPFYVADSAAALTQRAGELKLELRLTLEDERSVAVASFNRHLDHFGRHFTISAAGSAANSGCVAFGIERWVLAFLTQHGLDERRWPDPVRQAMDLRRAHAAR